jgi:hypothetical protein
VIYNERVMSADNPINANELNIQPVIDGGGKGNIFTKARTLWDSLHLNVNNSPQVPPATAGPIEITILESPIDERPRADQNETITISDFLTDPGKARQFCQNWRKSVGQFLSSRGIVPVYDYEANPNLNASHEDLARCSEELGLPMELWSTGDWIANTQQATGRNAGGGHWVLVLREPTAADTSIHVYDPLSGERDIQLQPGQTMPDQISRHLYKNNYVLNNFAPGTYNLEIPNQEQNIYLRAKNSYSQTSDDINNCGPMCLFNAMLRTSAMEIMSEETRNIIHDRFFLALPDAAELKTLGIQTIF